MKRKRLNSVAAVVVFGATLGVTSCTDLTEVPREEITEANFNPTAEDLTALIAPTYTPLRGMWMGWFGMVDSQGEAADMLLTPVRPNGWYDGGRYIRLHEHRWDPNQEQPAALWTSCYNGINSANRVIYQVEAGVIPLDETDGAGIVAELRAMRAYYYSILLDNFGNVPVVTDFTATELPEQAAREQVYEFVVNELTEVMPRLSPDVTGETYGRMNQWAARGILARVHLNAEVYTGTPRHDEVIARTGEIIESGLYGLDDRYTGPFARDNQNSPEIIFAVPYDAVFATGSNFHMKTLKADLQFVFGMNARPWGGSGSNPQFIDTYDPDDGRLANTWLMGPNFDDQGRGYDFVKHVPTIDDALSEHGFPVRKYEIYAGQTGSSDVDYPALRYAEVLMMRAEALLRTGQADAAAVLVTQVRQRNFEGSAASKATVAGAELLHGSRYNYGWYDTDGIVKIGPGGTPVHDGGADIPYGRFLDELRWEFAAEGHDRQMLIRFGVFTTKTWFNHEPNGDHRIIFAIPQDRLNTNSKLKQNPGY